MTYSRTINMQQAEVAKLFTNVLPADQSATGLVSEVLLESKHWGLHEDIDAAIPSTTRGTP